jgi:hypothetical protein
MGLLSNFAFKTNSRRYNSGEYTQENMVGRCRLTM